MQSGSSRAGVKIHGARFIEAVNYNEYVQQGVNNSFHSLQKNVVPGALHNSGERFDPPKCHPKTRKAVLDSITTWASNYSKRRASSQPIIWLSGPAGAGKSAIAQTLAELWDAEGMLAGSFFFSRTIAKRNEKTYLVSTIAYQLLQSFPEARTLMEKAIEYDPLIFTKTIAVQIEQLIIYPLVIAYPASRNQPMKVIVVDGLDECTGEGAQREITSAFTTLMGYANIPLLLFLTSRPEYQIRDAFKHLKTANLTIPLVLDEKYNPDADIKLFLRSKFTEIKAEDLVDDESWPSEEAIQAIVQKSSGQFIYASTVIKFIRVPHHDPRHSLEIILGLENPGQDEPYATLDALYAHILSSISKSSYETVMDILACLLHDSRLPHVEIRDVLYTSNSTTMLGWLFCLNPRSIRRHLIDLHSIIFLPTQDNGPGAQSLRFYHASFSDFLIDPLRSKEFCLTRSEASTRIVLLFVKHIFACLASADVYRTQGLGDGPGIDRLENVISTFIKEAECTPLLRSRLDAAMGPDSKLYQQTLDALRLEQTKQRKRLFRYLGTCGLKAEILKYLRRCYQEQEPSRIQRCIANIKLIPSQLMSTRCTSLNCTRHGHSNWRGLQRSVAAKSARMLEKSSSGTAGLKCESSEF